MSIASLPLPDSVYEQPQPFDFDAFFNSGLSAFEEADDSKIPDLISGFDFTAQDLPKFPIDNTSGLPEFFSSTDENVVKHPHFSLAAVRWPMCLSGANSPSYTDSFLAVSRDTLDLTSSGTPHVVSSDCAAQSFSNSGFSSDTGESASLTDFSAECENQDIGHGSLVQCSSGVISPASLSLSCSPSMFLEQEMTGSKISSVVEIRSSSSVMVSSATPAERRINAAISCSWPTCQKTFPSMNSYNTAKIIPGLSSVRCVLQGTLPRDIYIGM